MTSILVTYSCCCSSNADNNDAVKGNILWSESTRYDSWSDDELSIAYRFRSKFINHLYGNFWFCLLGHPRIVLHCFVTERSAAMVIHAILGEEGYVMGESSRGIGSLVK